MTDELPELPSIGHGRCASFRRGVAEALLRGCDAEGRPEGHERAHADGVAWGEALREAIRRRER